jgi:hypothetical protein
MVIGDIGGAAMGHCLWHDRHHGPYHDFSHVHGPQGLDSHGRDRGSGLHRSTPVGAGQLFCDVVRCNALVWAAAEGVPVVAQTQASEQAVVCGDLLEVALWEAAEAG